MESFSFHGKVFIRVEEVVLGGHQFLVQRLEFLVLGLYFAELVEYRFLRVLIFVILVTMDSDPTFPLMVIRAAEMNIV